MAVTPTSTSIGKLVTSGVQLTSAVLLATGVGAVAVPVVQAIGAILGPVLSLFGGCGSTCVQATAIANQAGAQMGPAFQSYMEAPVHYQSAQTAFLALFDAIMAKLQVACANPSLGAAGQACIQDNSPGACKWTASPGGWSQNSQGQWTYTYWGASGSGTSCWNPYTGIRAMVAQDPTVVADGTPSGGPVAVGSNSTTFTAPAGGYAANAAPAPGSTGSLLASLGVNSSNMVAVEIGLGVILVIVGALVIREVA